MRTAGTIMIGLVVLSSAPVAAPAAHVDAPSLSVNSITFTPGGPEVRQTITYRDLPDHSQIYYDTNRDFGGFTMRPQVGTCSMVGSDAVCSELSGSGAIIVAYGNDIPSRQAFQAADVATVDVRIDSLSLVATATVTAVPKADLFVRVALTGTGARITTYSYGPSVSGAQTLRISGFTQPVNVPTGTCELDGLVVICYMRELAPTVDPPSCVVGYFRACHAFTLTVDPARSPPLTATVSGPLADPDPSNNSKVIFPDAGGNAQPAPGPPPGSGSGGGSAGGSSSGGSTGGAPPTPDIAAEPEPTASTGAITPRESTGVTPPGLTATDPEPISGGSMTAVAVAVAGFIVGAGLSGGVGWITWRRLRRRRVAPGEPEPPTLVG